MLKNISIIISSLLVTVVVFLSTQAVFAQEQPSGVLDQQSYTVADVSVQDAKIVEQKGNIFKLSFNVVNGIGTQMDVRYGAQLMKVSAESAILVDEIVAPESLTLTPNSERVIDLEYVIPEVFSGTYSLVVWVKNEGGVPLGSASLGEVKSFSVPQGIEILNETCFLEVSEEGKSLKYNPQANIDIKSSEKLTLTCTVVSREKKDVMFKPAFESYEGGIGGAFVSSAQQGESILVKAGERKVVTIPVIGPTAPGSYYVKFSSTFEGFAVNTATFLYTVSGNAFSISSIIFDKDFYEKDDVAHISVLLQASSRGFRTGDPARALGFPASVSVNMMNSDGRSCGEPVAKSLSAGNWFPVIDMKISKDCYGPQASVSLLDTAGNVLVSKVTGVSVPESKKSWKLFIVILVAVLLVGVGALMGRKLLKNNSSDKLLVLAVFVVVSGFFFAPHTASAWTECKYDQWGHGGCFQFNIVSSYVNEPTYVSGSVYASPGWVTGGLSLLANVDGSANKNLLGPTANLYWVISTVGNHVLNVTGTGNIWYSPYVGSPPTDSMNISMGKKAYTFITSGRVPIVNISANPAVANSGTNSTLTWTATYATSCKLDGATVGLNSSKVVVVGASPTTYTLVCTNTYGSDTSSVIVSPPRGDLYLNETLIGDISLENPYPATFRMRTFWNFTPASCYVSTQVHPSTTWSDWKPYTCSDYFTTKIMSPSWLGLQSGRNGLRVKGVSADGTQEAVSSERFFDILGGAVTVQVVGLSDPSLATWSIDGARSLNGSGTINLGNQPVGSYTITWSSVNGYTTPAPTTYTLSGGALTITGLYLTGGTTYNGTINVNATTADASWTIVGPNPIMGARRIFAGDKEGFVIKENNTVWRWSEPSYGKYSETLIPWLPGAQIRDLKIISDTTTPSTPRSSMYALMTDGTIWAWGYNWGGNLGDGTKTNRPEAIVVLNAAGNGPLNNVVGIDVSHAGAYRGVYAVQQDGTLWAWGSSYLGNTNVVLPATLPVQVMGVGGTGFLTNVKQVSSGYSTVYALKNDGTVYAWGKGINGSLGDGLSSIHDALTPIQVKGSGGVGFLSNIVSINRNSATDTTGKVWVWGDDYYGSLATGSTGKTYLTPVEAPPRSVFVKVDDQVGLKADGTVWVWGGYVGLYGANYSNGTPDPILGEYGEGYLQGVKDISMSGEAIYAVTSDGRVVAFSQNPATVPSSIITGKRSFTGKGSAKTYTDSPTGSYSIQWNDVPGYIRPTSRVSEVLSRGGTLTFSGNYRIPGTIKVSVTGVDSASWKINGGNLMSSAVGVADVVGGLSNAGLVTADGLAQAWGDVFSPKYTESSLEGVKKIAVNRGGGAVVLKKDGTVWAWGLNSEGQLGNGSLVSTTTPIQMKGPNNVGQFTDALDVAAGGVNNYILKSDGTVWSAGSNDFGQLGDGVIGVPSDKSYPVQVKGLSGITAIAANENVAYALKSNGTVWAWGCRSGAYACTISTRYATPIQVAGLPVVSSIGANGNFGYALAGNTLWVWDGVGLGTLLNSGATPGKPKQILDGVSQVFSRYALKDDTTVWGWKEGSSYSGEEGSVVAQIFDDTGSPLSNVVSIGSYPNTYIGEAFSCALKTDKTVWCWEKNSVGYSPAKQVLNSMGTAPLSGIVRIAGGKNTAYAIDSGGTLWGWGANGSGQLNEPVLSYYTADIIELFNRKLPIQVLMRDTLIAGLGKIKEYIQKSPGSYTIEWGDIPGYVKPFPETKILSDGGLIEFIGEYTLENLNDGVCGPAATSGVSFTSEPPENMKCSSGTPAARTSTRIGWWPWSCMGVNGGEDNLTCGAPVGDGGSCVLDSVCSAGETESSCPGDCGVTAQCGTAVATPSSAVPPTENLCAAPSTLTSGPNPSLRATTGELWWGWTCSDASTTKSCGSPRSSTLSTCGNNICGVGESILTCPQDCKPKIQEF